MPNLKLKARRQMEAPQQSIFEQSRNQRSRQSIQREYTVVEQASPLLQLPHEILVHILSFILKREERVRLHSAQSRRWRNEAAQLRPQFEQPLRARRSPLLRILLTSKAFYFAGIEAFYGSNTLSFTSSSALSAFAKKLDSDRRQCVKRVALTIDMICAWIPPQVFVDFRDQKVDFTRSGLLIQLPNLREITIIPDFGVASLEYICDEIMWDWGDHERRTVEQAKEKLSGEIQKFVLGELSELGDLVTVELKISMKGVSHTDWPATL